MEGNSAKRKFKGKPLSSPLSYSCLYMEGCAIAKDAKDFRYSRENKLWNEQTIQTSKSEKLEYL
jgi:hypothetical protein